MVNDAKSHESEDKEKKRKVEARNQADAAAFQAEKQLKEYGDKLDADNKAKIEAGINRVKEALKSDNADEMTASVEALNQLWHAASAEMYKNVNQAQAGSGNGERPGAPPEDGEGKDKTIDAEFEEVK
jgi:molecular chaperone DnaK